MERYTNTLLPTLDRIREKSKIASLEAVDHLVLKMEWAAKRLTEKE